MSKTATDNNTNNTNNNEKTMLTPSAYAHNVALFNKSTKAKLLTFAKQYGMTGISKLNKADLLAKLHEFNDTRAPHFDTVDMMNHIKEFYPDVLVTPTKAPVNELLQAAGYLDTPALAYDIMCGTAQTELVLHCALSKLNWELTPKDVNVQKNGIFIKLNGPNVNKALLNDLYKDLKDNGSVINGTLHLHQLQVSRYGLLIRNRLHNTMM